MSGIYRTIDPLPPLHPAIVSSLRTKGGGLNTRRAVRGWGVNISEDARHWIGLLWYNPSTVESMKQISEMEGKPFTSSLTICPRSLVWKWVGACGVTPIPLFLICMIHEYSFKDDLTVMLPLGVTFMVEENKKNCVRGLGLSLSTRYFCKINSKYNGMLFHH